MKWFRKKDGPTSAAPVQLRETGRHPFGMLGGYAPLRSGETRLYRAVREAVLAIGGQLLEAGLAARGTGKAGPQLACAGGGVATTIVPQQEIWEDN